MMNANPTLLRMKYGRIVERFANLVNLPLEDALSFFYGSKTYELISQGISDMHCLSDFYLADELMMEYEKEKNKQKNNGQV
ncbi:MAG: DUF3791 domain-containing protein [Bacteroidaceae bacterium]|nr:DUF3791 domain-containing protein [Bacteroidaceae bacterium]